MQEQYVNIGGADNPARFPIRRNRLIDKKSRQVKKLEQVLIEKVCQLFRNLLWIAKYQLPGFRWGADIRAGVGAKSSGPSPVKGGKGD